MEKYLVHCPCGNTILSTTKHAGLCIGCQEKLLETDKEAWDEYKKFWRTLERDRRAIYNTKELVFHRIFTN